jgi:hypothetical protein
METNHQLQYQTQENPVAGDRIRNSEGRLGTVVALQNRNRDIGYGQLIVKWDDGVVEINYPFVREFALVSRAC